MTSADGHSHGTKAQVGDGGGFRTERITTTTGDAPRGPDARVSLK